jgi:hypothetical protein
LLSVEQLGTGSRELHIGPALVPQRIAAASAAWCAASFEKRAVDQLEEDAAILLNRFDRIGALHQLAGGSVGISEVARLDDFHGLG